MFQLLQLRPPPSALQQLTSLRTKSGAADVVCETEDPTREALAGAVLGLYWVAWLYPVYLLCYLLSCQWYSSLAQHAYATHSMQQHQLGRSQRVTDTPNEKDRKSGDRLSFVSGETYKLLLLAISFLLVWLEMCSWCLFCKVA